MLGTSRLKNTVEWRVGVDVSIYISVSDQEPEVRQKQEADFKKIFEKLDPEIPLICLSGNHDVGNSPTTETIDLLVFLLTPYTV
jgi:hypothetical protein